MNNRNAVLIFFLFIAQVVIAQKTILKWHSTSELSNGSGQKSIQLSFEGGIPHSNYGNLPIFASEKFNGVFSLTIINPTFEPVTSLEAEVLKNHSFITDTILYQTIDQSERGAWLTVAQIFPFIKSGSGFSKLVAFELSWMPKLGVTPKRTTNKRYQANSVLATGEWYKLAIPEDGIYSLNATFFTNLGINFAQIDPKTIKIFTNGGNELPQNNDSGLPFDLIEVPIWVQGEQDGQFNSNDLVIFFGQGPHIWKYDPTNRKFSHRINPYSDTAYVFLTFGGKAGLRVSTLDPPNGQATYNSQSYDFVWQHERDLVNFLKSGREWFGEEFDLIQNRNFSFELPNLIATEPVKISYGVAARSMGVSATFQLRANNNANIISQLSPNIISSNYLDAYAYTSQAEVNTLLNPGLNSLQFNFIKPTSFSIGWLNYIHVQARCNLMFSGGQMTIRDALSFVLGNNQIKRLEFLNNPIYTKVWDVTTPWNIIEMPLLNENNRNGIKWRNDSLRTFIAFDGTAYRQVTSVKRVENQNLHALQNAEMVIVSHPDFIQAANRLAQHHQSSTGLSVKVVDINQVYNEFSGGRQDIMAIRRLMKLLYDKSAGVESAMPKHLLLMGATSFDYKNRVPNNTNYIPTYQSIGSIFPTSSYCSDAFFALLDDHEGNFDINLGDRMDVNVGRLPVRTLTEANAQVLKIERYTSPSSFGDWKNIITLVADDEDQNVHQQQANELGNIIGVSYPTAIVEKIYLDMYQQRSVPGGTRYPDVNLAINNRVQNGSLIVNYTGHGGETGWAEERVLTIADINSWTNIDKLSVFVTATCEFTRYDDPSRLSAGELVLLNPNGGAIAMLTTTRLTFSTPNFSLSARLYRNFTFNATEKGYPSFGDIYRNTVNVDLSNINTRCFALLGDPAVRLPIPQNKTAITQFNDIEVTALPDTLKSLARVSFSGKIVDTTGNQLTQFNGLIFPTVFDKESIITTLANDPGSSRASISAFRNIIHRGRASVTNGAFKFSFIVPKDIAYQYGKGRINTYAYSKNIEAASRYDNIIVGGAASNVPPDDEGPHIDLYLNDNKFVNGGITNKKPLLLAFLADSSGLNTVGNGVGHDLIAILDENSQNPIILNNHYKSEIDDFTRGSVEYQLPVLSIGKHTLTLRAWDVYNNSSEKRIEFIVTDGEHLQISNLLNFPNPFTTQTTFHFDHNRPGEPLQALLQIYNVSGKIIKSFHQSLMTTGFHVDSFNWDGLDDFGDKIGRGVYIYRLKLKSFDGKAAEAIQKLVIF